MTFVNGQAGQLAFLNNINDAWTSYTPTLTNVSATVNEARYKQIGKTVTVSVLLTVTVVPSGVMAVSLPVTARSAAGTVARPIGQVSGFLSTVYVHGAAFCATTSTVSFVAHGAGAFWQTGVPSAWSIGNTFGFTVTYEAA